MLMKNILKEQGIPLVLTVLTFIGLCFVLYGFINLLNLLPSSEKIEPVLRKRDILIGFTIYLKTSIDFAIFMGNLMRSNPGWKKRIAIEFGTATGHAFGTILILLIWNFLREVPLLMALMIILAGLVLLKMAEESIEEFMQTQTEKKHIHKITSLLHAQLSFINRLFKPLLGRLIPSASITNIKSLSFFNLFVFSVTIPFILGLDDFAGYIPVFSIINVFGFAIGVFFAHMILNLGLFISPRVTTNLVKTPFVLAVGGIAFIGIAFWGFYEVINILLGI